MNNSTKKVGPVRWMDYSRRSMQRLGFLKLACGVSSPSTNQDLRRLTTRIMQRATSRSDVTASVSTRFKDYVKEQRLHMRYGDDVSSAELQDLYLSDPDIPSRTGALTGDLKEKGYSQSVYVEIPRWAIRLKLIRASGHTLTDRGKVLNQLDPRSDQSFLEFDSSSNPLILSLAEKYFFLFLILDIDGDLIAQVAPALIASNGTFSRAEFGSWLAQSLSEILTTRLARSTRGSDRALAVKAREVINSIANQVANQTYPGSGPRESLATSRCEPLVDCGIFVRRNQSRHAYELADGSKEFFRSIKHADSMHDFISNQFGHSIGSAYNLKITSGRDLDAKRFIAKSYLQLRQGLGYVAVRELAVFSIAQMIRDTGKVAEINDVEETILDDARQYGRRVRLVQSRRIGLPQVRYDVKLAESFL
jgi:hypothetical protein